MSCQITSQQQNGLLSDKIKKRPMILCFALSHKRSELLSQGMLLLLDIRANSFYNAGIMAERKNESHLVKALGWSLQGLVAAWQETAFRQEIAAFCLLIPLAFFVGQSGLERAMLLACLLLILIVEILNSAIEAAIDRIGAEQHPLSGRAKDLASAAVFISLINAALVWLLIALD